MIIRIVRMHFKPENVSLFLTIFNQSKSMILNMEGCLYLELWQDTHQEEVYITHSHWESEDALNKYRETEFFKQVWSETRSLFSEKPQAFSAVKVV